MLADLKRTAVRPLLLQILNFATVVATALPCGKGSACWPTARARGGGAVRQHGAGLLPRRLALPHHAGPKTRFEVGDITVYKIPGQEIPIVHRVIETHDEKQGYDQLLLTKGDNNDADDLGLYNGPRWMKRKNVVGKVRGLVASIPHLGPHWTDKEIAGQRYMPYVGYVTIVLNDYPKLKYLLLAGLGSRSSSQTTNSTSPLSSSSNRSGECSALNI
ncbi:hypothetical protein L7F22_023064 [Adiantum nelumboides]|nr:hypothetical protein [Adiantum nelumboides]